MSPSEPEAPSGDPPGRSAEILRARARALARPRTERDDADHGLEVATFRIGDERYAIETRYVLEVSRLEPATPVPGLPDFFLGVTNRRGELLAVVDLSRFLGLASATATDASRLVVLGDAQAEFGIAVDEANEIVKIAESALRDPSTVLGGTERRYLRGVTPDALVVIDGAGLLAEERLFVDQSEERSSPPASDRAKR